MGDNTVDIKFSLHSFQNLNRVTYFPPTFCKKRSKTKCLFFKGLLPSAAGTEPRMHAAVISRNLQQQRVIKENKIYLTKEFHRASNIYMAFSCPANTEEMLYKCYANAEKMPKSS